MTVGTASFDDSSTFKIKDEGRITLDHYRFVQLDVFTERAFQGNPLAVFPEASGLSDEDMQRIAREMNLSETVFVLPPTDAKALRRLRIFTPERELPFAGHPVVGTWNALAREGIVPKPVGESGSTRIYQELSVGTLPVDIEFEAGRPLSVVMTQGRFEIYAEVEDEGERAALVRALGLKPEELDESLPIQTISTGIRVLAVPVRTLEILGRCRVRAEELVQAYQRTGAIGCYVFARESFDGAPSQVHARAFVPDAGVLEDPATGGAAGPLAAYLVHHGALELEPDEGFFRFVIEQGDFIKRPSRIHAEVKGARGSIEQVRIGGPSIVVAHGQLMF